MAISSVNSWKIWGQDGLVSDLQRSFPGSIRHSYVISGPDFSGKTTFALAFAKALLCTQPPNAGEFCDVCRACRTTGRGLHPDMAVFDLAWQSEMTKTERKGQTLNIDTVRQVSRSVSMRPAEGRWRVVIVDDVETMQETAQEAFLKTLEEPPPYTVMLLLTTDASTLLPTILSRLTQLHMGSVATDDVSSALTDSGVAEQTAIEISRLAQGLVGWALRAVADPAMIEQRRTETQRAMEWIASTTYDRMVTAFRFADRFAADKEALFDDLRVVMLGWRSIMLHRLNVTDTHLLFDSKHNVFSRSLSSQECAVAIESVRQCIFDLESNVRPRLALQSMVSRWPDLPS
ncbi:MAG: hypothetical protein WKF81_05155 [Thermomicrobiales bacterium]